MCYTYIKMKIKTKSKKQIKPIYLNKLTKTEFFDVYGISLLHPQVTLSNAYLLSLLLPLAQKYYNITYHAITAELRYFLRGCVSNFYNEFTIEVSPTNRGLLKKLKITDFKNQRKKLKLAQIFQLFHCGDWVKNIYGGEAWAKITKACDDLKAAMATKNIPIICMAIDRIFIRRRFRF